MWAVWLKELLEHLRDVRTVLINVVAPLLILPLLFVGVAYLAASQAEREAERLQKIVLLNGDQAPMLVQLLKQDALQFVDSDDPEADLREGRIEAIVLVPEGFEAALAAGRPAGTVTVRHTPARTASQIALGKIQSALRAYREGLIRQRLTQAGLPPELLEPFAVQTEGVEASGGGGTGVFLLVYLLVLYAAIGGAYLAIDATAGEKERGTLEMLLTTPVSRTALAGGKILATFTVTCLSLALVILSLQLIPPLARLLPFEAERLIEEFRLAPSLERGAWVVVLSVALAALMSAVEVALFTWARNFREAQSYVGWLTLVILAPVLVAHFGEAAGPMLLVPVYNVALVLRELLTGPFKLNAALLALGSSLLYAGIAWALAVRVFRHEQVIFRQ